MFHLDTFQSIRTIEILIKRKKLNDKKKDDINK